MAFRRAARYAHGWTMGGGDSASFAESREKLGDYYAWLGPYAEHVVEGAAKDADTVRAYVSGFEEAGVDEVIAFPASPDPEQVDLLADAVR